MKNQLRIRPRQRLSLQPMLITGHVTDMDSKPRKNVQIFFQGRNIGTSGRNGFFKVKVFDLITHIPLTWELDGFVPHTQVILKTNSNKAKVEVTLQPIMYCIKLDAQEGLHSHIGGTAIEIPPQALVSLNGDPYLGSAKLTFSIQKPISQQQDHLSENAEACNCQGIIHLSIGTVDNQPLQLAPDSNIKFSIRLPKGMVRANPSTMGLFKIDPSNGQWQLLQSLHFHPRTNQYTGTLSNLGGTLFLRPIEDGTIVDICIRDLQSQSPMPNMHVVAHGKDCDIHGITDAQGRLRLHVPSDATLILEAQGHQNNTHYLTPHPAAIRILQRVAIDNGTTSPSEDITIWVHPFPTKPDAAWYLPKHASFLQ